MEIEIEAVLYRGGVDLGDEPAGIRQRGPVQANAVRDCDELVRRLFRVPPASAANVDSQLLRERGEAALECTDHARGDARRVPVHAHHRAEALEPEGMGEAADQLVAPVLEEDRLDDHPPHALHPLAEPRGDAPAVEREVGAAGAVTSPLTIVEYAIVFRSATTFSSLSYESRSGWMIGAPGSIAATKSLTAGSGS